MNTTGASILNGWMPQAWVAMYSSSAEKRP